MVAKHTDRKPVYSIKISAALAVALAVSRVQWIKLAAAPQKLPGDLRYEYARRSRRVRGFGLSPKVDNALWSRHRIA